MLWCARLKRIQHIEYHYSLHEGSNCLKQALFSNLCSLMTMPANKFILAEGAKALPVTLSGGVYNEQGLIR